MGWLKEIFGSSQGEIWSQIAAEIGGEHIDNGFWKHDQLRYRHREWEMLLDSHTVYGGQYSPSFTRLRAPFINKDGLYFRIYRESAFHGIAKYFGMQDIQIGDDYFDTKFIIKGNNVAKVRVLLADPKLQELIREQPDIRFEIASPDDWSSTRLTDEFDELKLECLGVITETRRLRAMFDLFCCTLNRLVRIDSAYADDPNVTL